MLQGIQLPRVFCVGLKVVVLLRTEQLLFPQSVCTPSVLCVSPTGTVTCVGDCSVRVTCWYRYLCE